MPLIGKRVFSLRQILFSSVLRYFSNTNSFPLVGHWQACWMSTFGSLREIGFQEIF